MEARNRTLPQWLERIRSRQISLPRFQRFEAWTHQQVAGLLDTVLHELPAGAVLVLEVGDEEQFQSRTVVGAPTTGDRVTEQLLDGQQRLTALWRVLHNNYSERSYFVQLQTDEETGAPYAVKSWQRWEKNGKIYPEWLNSSSQLWKQKLVPVHLLRPDTQSADAVEEWAQAVAGEDWKEVNAITRQISALRQKFHSFNIPYLSLPSTTPQETALNVFIQMNTSATVLSAYDIVVAQVEAGMKMSLHDLVGDLKIEIPHIESYGEPADLMLSVGALLQDKVPAKTSFLSKGFGNSLVENWDRLTNGLKRAVAFLEDEKVFDGKRLPTDVVLATLAALWSDAPQGLDAEGRARTILRKYFWRACFTERYERTSATRSLVDYRELKALICGQAVEPLIFNDIEYSLPTREQLLTAGWPAKKDRLPRAILCVTLREGGLDLADGAPVTRDNLNKREYHHLYPVARLAERGLSEREIYRALNCALVSWKTNRNISAKEPEKYLAQRREGTILGDQELQHRLDSHLIPFAELEGQDYSAFLQRRAEMVWHKMQSLCEGKAQ